MLLLLLFPPPNILPPENEDGVEVELEFPNPPKLVEVEPPNDKFGVAPNEPNDVPPPIVDCGDENEVEVCCCCNGGGD